MKVNHLNLVVPDVGAATDFFTTHFDFQPQTKASPALQVLLGPDGFVLVLMRSKAGEPASYPGAFHLGFGYATPEEVKAKHAQLSAAGLPAEPPGPQHGSFVFYLRALDFPLLEVACPLPAAA